MPKQQGKIGRNIASMFEGIVAPVAEELAAPSQVDLESGERVVDLPVNAIQLDPVQVRYMMALPDLQARARKGSRWAQEQLSELQALGEHMRMHGQIQPIRVFRTGVGRPYQVLVGHRRMMAAELAGLPSVKAVVLAEEPDELQKLEFQVGENVHRRNFNDMERARIFERYKGAIARRGRPRRTDEPPALDDATIAERLGVKPDRMAQIFRLTRFARRAQDIIIEEGWPETVLRPLHQALAALQLDEQTQVEVLHELARRAALRDAPLSNMMVAEYVRELQRAELRGATTSWMQSQLRQLADASRDLARLRKEFASGRPMPEPERIALREALQSLAEEVRQTRAEILGEDGNS